MNKTEQKFLPPWLAANKKLKLHWLKCSKTVAKNKIWTRK